MAANSTPSITYVQPTPSAINALLVELVGPQGGKNCKNLSSFNKSLKKALNHLKPERPQSNPILLHRIAAPLKVGNGVVEHDIDVQMEGDQAYVKQYGHGDAERPAGISLFVPLADTQTFEYAHQQMFRFGDCCYFTSNLAPIHGTYAVVDRIAMRTDAAFGLHVTLSVNTSDVLFSDFNALAQCQAPQDAWSTCRMKANAEVKLVKRPEVDDFDSKLILHLLDLVTTYSTNPQDCFLAAYYSFVFATFSQDNSKHHIDEEEEEEEEEETHIPQLLKFGGDDIILSLVIKSAEYLCHSQATTANYFDLEMILSIARQMANGVPLVCYATPAEAESSPPIEVNAGRIMEITKANPSERHIRKLLSWSPSFEIMVSSLVIRTSSCRTYLLPEVESVLRDPEFLAECAARCSLDHCWTPVAVFPGTPSRKLRNPLRGSVKQNPRDFDTIVSVFEVDENWHRLHGLNNALMALTRLVRHQLEQACAFFATHPSSQTLRLSLACGDFDAYVLQPDALYHLNKNFPGTDFIALHDEIQQERGSAHLFMFSWSKTVENQLAKLVRQTCSSWNVQIKKHVRFTLPWPAEQNDI